MESWLQNIFSWLPQGGPYYALIGLIALLESITGIGLLVPGSVIAVFAGFLTIHGKGEILPVILASSLGSFLGDLLSFWMGARLGNALIDRTFLRRRRTLLRRAEAFFAAHGGKSVFFGRFFGPVRGLIPFVAGGSRMNGWAFFAYTLTSTLLWGLAYPGMGYVGGASWEKVRQLSGGFSLFIGVLLALFVLNGLFWAKLAPRLSLRIGRGWNRVRHRWSRLLQRPRIQSLARRYPALWSFLAGRFTLQRGSGLYLTVGFLASAFFAGLFLWMVGDFAPLVRLDLALYLTMEEVRHPGADAVALALASLASPPALLMIGLYLLFWLVVQNRDFSAVILVAGMMGGELLISFLHAFFYRPGPVPYLSGLHDGAVGFPSGQAFSAALLMGLTLYFLLGSFAQWQIRIKLIMAGSFLLLLIAFSRIYLGLQWTSGVLAGMTLAAVWVTFLITAAEMRKRYGGEFPWRSGWQPVQLKRSWRTVLLSLAGVATAAGLAVFLSLQIQRL